MSREYILNHFEDIKNYENIIEKRLYDDYTLEDALRDNERALTLAQKHNVNYLLIKDKYEINL